jgi:hypothetical protein
MGAMHIDGICSGCHRTNTACNIDQCYEGRKMAEDNLETNIAITLRDIATNCDEKSGKAIRACEKAAREGLDHIELKVSVEDRAYLFTRERQVLELSLDNDLGEGLQEGYVVLNFLEETVFNDETFPVPLMAVHSSNASRVQDMNRAITSIYRMESKRAHNNGH